MDSRTKFSSSLLLLLPAAAGLVMRVQSEIWPIFPVTLVAFGFLLFYTFQKTEYRWTPAISGVIGFSVLLSHVVLIPASLIGRDTPWFFLSGQKIAQTGSIESIAVGFYSQIPAFPVYLSALLHVFESPRTVMLVLVLVVSLTLPATVGYLSGAISDEREAVVFAIGATIISQVMTKVALFPIAQLMHVLMICLAGAVLLQYQKHQKERYLALLLVILVLWMTVHKLPLLMFVGGAAGILFISVIGGYVSWIDSTPLIKRTSIFVGLLAGVLFTAQQVVITSYLPTQLITLFTPIESFGFVRSYVGGSVSGGILSYFNIVSNERVVVLAATLSLASLVVYYRDKKSWTALGYISGSIGIGAIAVIAWVPTTRILLSLFPLLFAAIGVGFLLSKRQFGPVGRSLIGIFVVILVLSQAFAPGSMLDDPRNAQRYLDQEAADSKLWAAEYSANPVYSTPQYASAILPSRLDDVATAGEPSLGHTQRGKFREITAPEILQSRTVAIINVDFYPAKWIYEYFRDNPDYEETRNQIYSSGNVTITSP